MQRWQHKLYQFKGLFKKADSINNLLLKADHQQLEFEWCNMERVLSKTKALLKDQALVSTRKFKALLLSHWELRGRMPILEVYMV